MNPEHVDLVLLWYQLACWSPLVSHWLNEVNQLIHPELSSWNSAAKIYKKNGDISLSLKAYNGRCALAWLSDVVYEASLNPEFAAVDERFDLIAAALTLGIFIGP